MAKNTQKTLTASQALVAQITASAKAAKKGATVKVAPVETTKAGKVTKAAVGRAVAKVAPKAINATVIGLYYLAFFTSNALVGWIGGFYETMPTTTFWLLHAGLAGGAFAGFVAFRIIGGRFLKAA